MSEQTAAAALGYPFAVMDAALGEFLRAEYGAQWQWKQLTSGSSIHSVVHGETEVFRILVRAMSATRSSLVLEAAIPSFHKWNDGIALFQRFEAWVKQDQATLRRYMPRPEEDDESLTQSRGKRGRQLEPKNAWAVKQFEQGKQIDDILLDYARRSRDNPVVAREALRKVFNAWKKKRNK